MQLQPALASLVSYTCQVSQPRHGILLWIMTLADGSRHAVRYIESDTRSSKRLRGFPEILVSLDHVEEVYVDGNLMYTLRSTFEVNVTERLSGSVISCNNYHVRSITTAQSPPPPVNITYSEHSINDVLATLLLSWSPPADEEWFSDNYTIRIAPVPPFQQHLSTLITTTTSYAVVLNTSEAYVLSLCACYHCGCVCTDSTRVVTDSTRVVTDNIADHDQQPDHIATNPPPVSWDCAASNDTASSSDNNNNSVDNNSVDNTTSNSSNISNRDTGNIISNSNSSSNISSPTSIPSTGTPTLVYTIVVPGISVVLLLLSCISCFALGWCWGRSHMTTHATPPREVKEHAAAPLYEEIGNPVRGTIASTLDCQTDTCCSDAVRGTVASGLDCQKNMCYATRMNRLYTSPTNEN